MRVPTLLYALVSLSVPLHTVGISSSFRIDVSEAVGKVPPEFLGLARKWTVCST